MKLVGNISTDCRLQDVTDGDYERDRHISLKINTFPVILHHLLHHTNSSTPVVSMRIRFFDFDNTVSSLKVENCRIKVRV